MLRAKEEPLFLNGIKYQIAGTNETVSFKFKTSESRFRNVMYHLESEEGRLLFPALQYGLLGRSSSNINAVMLYVADSNGDQWQVERRGGTSRFYKNRQDIDGDGESAFRSAMLDGMEDDSLLFDVFTIGYENSQLVSCRDTKQSPFQAYYQEKGREKLEDLMARTCKFLGSSQIFSLANLITFSNRSRNILAEYTEGQHHLKVLKENFGTLQEIDPDFTDALEAEVDLLRSLERDADFLRDPATSFDVLKGKLKKINNRLYELCESNEIGSLPTIDQEIPWDKVILVLSRLQAYERLELAYRGSVNHIDNMVKPLFKDHIRSMKEFLSDDKRLLGDIEKALQTLTNRLGELAASEVEVEKGVFAKIFGEKIKDTGERQPLDPEILASSRQSVDRVLRSLGAMCSNLELTTSSYTEGFDGIQERYEKIVKKLGASRQEWMAISKKYSIDPNSTLKSFLNLINNLSQISSLYSKKVDITQSLQLYKSRLRKLERRVVEWRTLTGSQKSNDLRQIPILIAEIRNMLQYKEKKESQLKKAQKLKAKLEFCRVLTANSEDTLKACRQKWNDNFALLNLDPLEINKKNWSQFFLLVDQTKACAELLKMEDHNRKDEEIISAQNLMAPLNIMRLHNLDPEGQLEFIRQLEFLSHHVNVLILLEEKNLANMLTKMEIGSSIAVKQRNQKNSDSNLPRKKSQQRPIMSERARTALELFKGRISEVSD